MSRTYTIDLNTCEEMLKSIAQILEGSNLEPKDRVVLFIDKYSDHEALIKDLIRQGILLDFDSSQP